MKIGCCILAGGQSSRMGTDKALLEHDGKNFIKIISDELAFFEEKVIARGDHPRITQVDWPVLPDIYPNRGPIGGLHAILTSCESDAMFFVSCDMPLLKRNLAQNLIDQMDEETDAVISVTKDGRMHPLCGLYKKSVVPLLERQILDGNNRMMAAVRKMKVKYIDLNEEESSQLQNINTPKEYEELTRIS